MSSILKALKKLEDDKSVYKPESLKIDSNILRRGKHNFRGVRSLMTLLLIFLAVGIATTFIVFSEKLITPQKNENIPSASQASSNPSAPQPGKRQPVTFFKSSPPIQPLKQIPQNPVQAKPKLTKEQKEIAAPKPDTRSLQTTHLPPPTPSRPAPPSPPLSTIPLLKVNGIAYQEGTTEHIAIVNGTSVSVGSVIDGAKVEEILKDRVKFSINREKVEVSLGSSNQ